MSKEFDDMNQGRELLDRARSSLDTALSHWYETKSAYENACRAWQLKLAQPTPETPAVPEGHFGRGDIIAVLCKNCGKHYADHTHTDESSTCPTANRESEHG